MVLFVGAREDGFEDCDGDFFGTEVRNMNNRVCNNIIISSVSVWRKIYQTPIRVVSWISSKTTSCMLLPLVLFFLK